jgi:hypothetical protein
VTQLTDAELLLQELGITEPEEIDLEAIAWHVGATVKHRILDGCEARIVGAENRAIITVNAASTLVRQRFSIGHEIGHWRHHRGRTLVCRSEDIEGHGDGILERQADAFAANLLMPGYILRPYLSQFKALTFNIIRETANAFNTSLSATAIRLVEYGTWPAILVCNGLSGRKWFVRNRAVPERWSPVSELNAESYAFGILFGDDLDQTKPRPIKAHIWFNCWDAKSLEIREQSMRTIDGETLSLLLISDFRTNAIQRWQSPAMS